MFLAYKMKDLLVDYEYQGVKYTKPFCKIKGRNPEVVVTDVYPAPPATVDLGNLQPAVPTPIQPLCYVAECKGCDFPKAWSCDSKPQPTPAPFGYGQEQGNNPMNYAYTNAATATVIADTSEKDKRSYLASRLSDLRYEKLSDIDDQFGFGQVMPPKDAKEALKRLQEGKFTIQGAGDDEPKYRYFDFWEQFSWRYPSVKQDEEGRDAAYEQVETFYKDLMDIIKVKPLDEAFDTLKALKDWQPTGKAN